MKTFTVSVSRLAKGKEGYKRNKYQFGWSFYPETHTIESLIRLAAIEGYSFLAGEFDRKPPTHYGRTDVSTPRITENFRQTVIVPLDDDGKATNAVAFWENDPLFTTHGAGYYHSTSSTPHRPRLRPIFELDKPITSTADYQLARRALAWYYNRDVRRVDELPQVPQVWYGSLTPTEYRIFGGVLPLATLATVIIKPYRAHVEGKRLIDNATPKTKYTGDIDPAIKWLSRQNHGRHTSLLWLGGIAKSSGVKWDDIGAAVINACQLNGYYKEYARSDREVKRVFMAGAK